MAIHNSIRAIASSAQLRVNGGVVSEESRFASLSFFMDAVRKAIPICVYNYAKDFEGRQRANRLIAERDLYPASLYKEVCCIPVNCTDIGCDPTDAPSGVKEYTAILPFMPMAKLGNRAIKYVGSQDRCSEVTIVGSLSKGKPMFSKQSMQGRFVVRGSTPLLVLRNMGDIDFICIEAIPQDPTAVGATVGSCNDDSELSIPQEVLFAVETMVVNSIVPQINVKPQINNTNTSE
jgi:hypothetical protein